MKNLQDIETIQDILDTERDMITLAERTYGNAFRNASEFNDLLKNFLKEAKSEAWIFILFLSQIKKNGTLAPFWIARLHHIQAMLNLRQVLEAGVNAAYGLAYPNEDDFIIKQRDGTLDASEILDGKRRKWIEKNHAKHSTFIKKMKAAINKSCAHSNMAYAFNNFSMADYKFHIPYFDKREEHQIKADYWLIGNITLGLMDLFYGINRSVNRITFVDDFVVRLKKLEADNHALRDELRKHPRFNIFVPELDKIHEQ